MVYNVIYVSIALFFVFGVGCLIRAFRDLVSERRNLQRVQSDLSDASDHNDMPLAEQYGSHAIGRWVKVCRSRRIGFGLSTPAEALEGYLFDISGRYDNLIRFTITSLIILGLLGTFIGMIIALFNASDIISEIRVPSLAAEISTEKRFEGLLSQLDPVIHGMQIAFITSIMGLSSSMLLGIAFAVYSNSRASFRIEAMAFANEILVPLFTPVAELGTGQAVEKYITSMEDSLQRIENISKGIFQGMNNELGLVFARIADRLNESAERNTNILSEFRDEISEQNRMAVNEIVGATEKMAELIDESVKNSAELVKELSSEVSNQNKLLIEEVTNATKTVIETTLSGLQGELKSLYEQMIADRKLIDAKLNEFLDEATESARSVSAENRKLIGQIQQQLATELSQFNNTLDSKLSKIDNTLSVGLNEVNTTLSASLGGINDSLDEQLSGLTKRLDIFDVPIKKAAEKIEGSQESFAKFMERVIRDMELEFHRQNESNDQQLKTLTEANQKIGVFLTQLNESSRLQSSNTQALADNVSSLNKNVISLSSNIESLSSTSDSLGGSITRMDHNVQALEASLKNYAEKSNNMALDLSELSSFNQSINTMTQSIQALGTAVNKLLEQTKYQSTFKPRSWRFWIFGKRK